LQAKAAFDSGAFLEAAELLKQAHALKPSPALLYNLGRAYQQAGDRLKAIDAYEAYLAAQAHSADEGAVRNTVQQLRDELRHEEELRQRADAERARAEDEAAKKRGAELAADAARRASVVAERRARRTRSLPWIIAGVGGAGLILGGVFGGLTLSRHSAAVSDPDASAAQSEQNQAKTFATVANVAFVTGGVLAAAGVVWGIVDVRAAARSGRVRASVGPTNIQVAVDF
jgi:tetratricopeptide (TPR) repeat protein